jgi:hypothetical protein
LTGGTLTGGLIGTTGSFSSSGSGDTFTIGHTSGSGIALNITKNGNGEGLYINKASGSGNALTVIGSTSLGALSGTSATFSTTSTFNGISTGVIAYFNAPTSGGTITFQTGGTSFADIGAELGNFGTGSATNLCISARSGKDLILGGGALKTLTLASTGAATFSAATSAITLTTNGAANQWTSKVLANSTTGQSYGLTVQAGTNSSDIGFQVIPVSGSGSLLYVRGDGNVGIGTSSPKSYSALTTSGMIVALGSVGITPGEAFRLNNYYNPGSGTDRTISTGYAASVGMNNTDGAMTFNLSSSSVAADNNVTVSERARITSGGFLKASNTGSYNNVTGTFHELRSNVSGNYSTNIQNTNASPFGLLISYTNTLNNNTNRFLDCEDNTTLRFSARSNGGLANFQANDVNLSDERTKKDIIPLESYWDKFKAIEIVKFKYKDQTHDDFNIGVIAQQVESVAPEFIDVDGWDNKPKLDEDGNEIVSTEEPLKSVYTSDLHHATIKVLQEAMAKIETLEAKIAILEAK